MTGPEIIVLWAIIVGGAVLLSVVWAVAWVTVATAEMDNAIGEVDWDDDVRWDDISPRSPLYTMPTDMRRLHEKHGLASVVRGASPFDQDSPADRVYR